MGNSALQPAKPQEHWVDRLLPCRQQDGMGVSGPPWLPLGLDSVSIRLWCFLTFSLCVPGSASLNVSQIWNIFSFVGQLWGQWKPILVLVTFPLNFVCAQSQETPLPPANPSCSSKQPVFEGKFVHISKTINCFKSLLWVIFWNKMVTGIKSLPSGTTWAGLFLSLDYLPLQLRVRPLTASQFTVHLTSIWLFGSDNWIRHVFFKGDRQLSLPAPTAHFQTSLEHYFDIYSTEVLKLHFVK